MSLTNSFVNMCNLKQVYCIIDTNDRFKFAHYDDVDKNEDVEWLRKGVDFQSCNKTGRNIVFLDISENGLSYNGRIVFTRDELKQFHFSVNNYDNDSDEESDNDSNEDSFTDEKQYVIQVSASKNNDGNVVSTSDTVKCVCNSCKHSKSWFKANTKYIYAHGYINSLEEEEKWAIVEPNRSDKSIIKDYIEFFDKEIVRVGQLGSHVALYVPYNENLIYFKTNEN